MYSLATVHTHFDFLHSTLSPRALLDAAQQIKLGAIGVVDRATTLSHVPLLLAARDTGIHVVLGTSLLMEDGLPLRLLARTDDGYRNLCRLIAAYHRIGPLPWDVLRDHRHGLMLLEGGRQGRIWQALGTGDERPALLLMTRLEMVAERPDAFVVEAQQYGDDAYADGERLRVLLDLAAQSGTRVIATHDARVPPTDDGRTLRLLQAIAQRRRFDSADPALPTWQRHRPSRHALPTPSDWYQTWNGLDQLVAESAALLRACDVELLERPRFPGASLPADIVYDRLVRQAFAGLRQRYATITPPLMQRLQHEIDQIHTQGVGAFLLTAATLVERAAQRGIRLILQGSGTGSLICYALGVSPVDPVLTHGGLVFERFAGTHRGAGDLPDLDFGCPADRVGEVQAILEELYGPERVARLVAVTTLREQGARSAVATAFGWDREAIRALHHKVQRNLPLESQDAMILRAADQIGGAPHHLATHSSGVIIADEPLADLYGVAQHADGPRLLANKDDVEQLQLLKFDVLRWYLLAILDQAQTQLARDCDPVPNVWDVPPIDQATADLLARGQTRSIPYLQSPAMAAILHALQVRDEWGITLALGALRPGASHTRPRLLAALRGGTAELPGWETLTPEHQAAITTALVPSYGAFIFDEDLLRVAHALGLSFADAELLRKALKQGEERAQPWLNRVHAAALDRGWSTPEVQVVQGWLHYIERYTFTLGHALAMAHVVWRVAYLAAHFPAYFYAAVLDWLGDGSDAGGMYPSLVYVTEAKTANIDVSGPFVNGPWQSTPHGTTVQCGLRVLRRVIDADLLATIYREAQLRPFKSIVDLRQRVDLPIATLDRLIAAGACDTLTPSRRAARWQAHQPLPRPDQGLLIADDMAVPPAITSEDMNERATEEYATLGWTVSIAHPLDLYDLPTRGVRPSTDLVNYVGTEVTIIGIVVARRRIRSTNGTAMLFTTLADRGGVVELVAMEQQAEMLRDILTIHTIVAVIGTVEVSNERGQSVRVHHAKRLTKHMANNANDDTYATT